MLVTQDGYPPPPSFAVNKNQIEGYKEMAVSANDGRKFVDFHYLAIILPISPAFADRL